MAITTVGRLRAHVKDITGRKFHRLTVILEAEPYISPKGKRYRKCLCRCECGKQTEVLWENLKRGHSRSCGCFSVEITGDQFRTHGGRKTRTYRVWANMKTRCYNSTVSAYENYGGRGISVCERWLNSFEKFLEDMGQCPVGMSINRIDNNGNYTPSNCQWADLITQANNTRRNHWIEYKGERRTLAGWAKKTGINRKTLCGRLERGWPMALAMSAISLLSPAENRAPAIAGCGPCSRPR